MNIFKNKKYLFLVFFSFILSASASVMAIECSDLPEYNNRGIEKVTFKRDTSGELVLQVKPYISVQKSDDEGVNLSFDIHVSVNNSIFDIVSEDVVSKGAITCAETCAGECPSIFGDGTCTNCNCNYGYTTAIPLPGVKDGDRIKIEIIAARGGEEDRLKKDDVREFVFKSTMVR